VKELTNGGVCTPKGFFAGGIRCGIKPTSQKKDLALIYSPDFCSAAAMFTANLVKAASILVSQENIADGNLHAVIVNSGNANACTGLEGEIAARRMTELAADILSIKPSEVAVASTGVIGVPLPISVIEENISVLRSSLRDDEQGHADALEAIMTTDTRKKEVAVEIEINGKSVRIGAMAKGSGMINPNMAPLKQATMLTFITTDAAITASALNESLSLAVKKSFNRLSVDGDTSTNDMVLIMANAKAGNKIITETSENDDFLVFSSALEYVCISLTKMIARDGEGATKLVTVNVKGALNEDTAEALAKSVISSSLVKTACFGADANWGRVLCAMGYAGVNFDPQKTSVCFRSKIAEIEVFKEGKPIPFSEEKAKVILSEEKIEICISLQEGTFEASAWGCDLTYDYVKINGDYRS
jgi:glutamate N-acetyltransferase/amino-acid N-acetyltransferase